jgi:hypothetical protein
MVGDAVAPDVPETYTQAPLNPVPTTNPTPVPTTSPVDEAAPSPGTTTLTNVPSPAKTYAPLNLLLFVPAMGVAVLLRRRIP